LSTATHADHALARSLHGYIERSGGFTLHRHTRRPLCQGVSVGADPRTALVVGWDRRHRWDHDTVVDWIHRHADHADHEDLHLGGWLDPRRAEVCLDLVRVYPDCDRREALLSGLRHQQHAVFDIGARSLVHLAGITATGVDALLAASVLGATG
jgi:hypothetical protein